MDNLSAPTVFKNHQKISFFPQKMSHFQPIFVLFKMTCLVTLFDRKLQVFQKFAKLTIVGILSVACFARNIVFETF